MTENGDPLENAIAERLNGIIKEEYLEHYQFKNINELHCKLDQAVNYYNVERPHLSCSMKTPNMYIKTILSPLKIGRTIINLNQKIKRCEPSFGKKAFIC